MSDENLVTLSSKIQREYQGHSLIDYLCARYPYKSREEWMLEIQAGRVQLNEKRATGHERVAFGDISSHTSLRIEPWVNKDVRVISEDEFMLFADKPAPLSAHADGVFVRNTLIYIIRQLRPDTELFLAHRLDRETSGVNVLAKSSVMLSALMPLFQKGLIEKKYLAVCRGLAENDEFEVEGGMAPDPASEISIRQKLFPIGTPDSKPSKTKFKVVKRLKNFSLIECQPLTGRTNQIRVHLTAVGLPIAGDKLYGRNDAEFLEFLKHVKAGGDSRFDGRYESRRQLLHAASLRFKHPITEQEVFVEAGLPEDMREFINKSS